MVYIVCLILKIIKTLIHVTLAHAEFDFGRKQLSVAESIIFFYSTFVIFRTQIMPLMFILYGIPTLENFIFNHGVVFIGSLCLGVLLLHVFFPISSGLERFPEISSYHENYIRQILELANYQTKTITSQVDEISDLRKEQASLTQAIKAIFEKMHSKDQNIDAQKNEMMIQKKDIKAQAEGMKSQAKKIIVLEKK